MSYDSAARGEQPLDRLSPDLGLETGKHVEDILSLKQC